MPLRSLAPLLRLVAASAAVLLLIDITVFRSGLYFPWAEPDSTAGSVVRGRMAIERSYEPGRKNLLVLGNSRIGEAFSATLADVASGRKDLHFVNGSIAGTTPRTWYYLLREIDPDANRFSAIALMVDYDPADTVLDMTNYALDTSYALPLLRLTDLVDFPDTFTTPERREHARRSIILPVQALHDDIRDLLAHPFRRYRQVHHQRAAWLDSIEAYPGRDESLPDLAVDPGTGMPVAWGADEAVLRPKLEGYFRQLRAPRAPDLQSANDAYLREWLGRIVRRYAARGVPVIAFVVPRGPWHHAQAPAPVARGAVAELARDHLLHMLPGDAFVALEEPQYFFDAFHMNRAGRERFSRMFAQAAAPLVP